MPKMIPLKKIEKKIEADLRSDIEYILRDIGKHKDNIERGVINGILILEILKAVMPWFPHVCKLMGEQIVPWKFTPFAFPNNIEKTKGHNECCDMTYNYIKEFLKK